MINFKKKLDEMMEKHDFFFIEEYKPDFLIYRKEFKKDKYQMKGYNMFTPDPDKKGNILYCPLLWGMSDRSKELAYQSLVDKTKEQHNDF